MSIIKKKIYLAGPLFTHREIENRLSDEVSLINDLNDFEAEGFKLKLDIFNPIKFNFDIKFEETQRTTFYEKDYFEIKNSDIMIADLDSLDSGTLLELGIFLEMMNINKNLKCYVIWSNWKIEQIPNKFVDGAIVANGTYAKTIDDVIYCIKNDFEKEMKERKLRS